MNNSKEPKFLIVRFSSIGDIIQTMSVMDGILSKFPTARIDWITRKDMSGVLSMDARIGKVWRFDRKSGLSGLVQMAKELRQERYDYIYDAHNNLRSSILKLILAPFAPLCGAKLAVRSKERFKRLMLFKFRVNLFDRPFKSVASFQKPLKKWGITDFPVNKEWSFSASYSDKFDSLVTDNCVTIVPSSNWAMKSWAPEQWQQLVRELPDHRFVILAGPQDSFCQGIADVAPERVVNMAGRCSLDESCYIVYKSNIVVSADTGLMHAADLFRVPTLALMGPTAFGFPSAPTTKILERDMKCRPCTKDGRGKCKMAVYQQCMVDITPRHVAECIKDIIG
ncbi:MAG: glycosyltransferase family 9 protein [Rikenellaceae bacterium]